MAAAKLGTLQISPPTVEQDLLRLPVEFYVADADTPKSSGGPGSLHAEVTIPQVRADIVLDPARSFTVPELMDFLISEALTSSSAPVTHTDTAKDIQDGKAVIEEELVK